MVEGAAVIREEKGKKDGVLRLPSVPENTLGRTVGEEVVFQETPR